MRSTFSGVADVSLICGRLGTKPEQRKPRMERTAQADRSRPAGDKTNEKIYYLFNCLCFYSYTRCPRILLLDCQDLAKANSPTWPSAARCQPDMYTCHTINVLLNTSRLDLVGAFRVGVFLARLVAKGFAGTRRIHKPTMPISSSSCTEDSRIIQNTIVMALIII